MALDQISISRSLFLVIYLYSNEVNFPLKCARLHGDRIKEPLVGRNCIAQRHNGT